MNKYTIEAKLLICANLAGIVYLATVLWGML